MFWLRLKFFFKLHWIKVLVIVGLIGSIIWPVVMLRRLDPYQQQWFLTWTSLMPIQSVIYGGIFVLMYAWLFLGGGFARMTKRRVRGAQVNVKWSDVIGMEAAKQEAWEVVQLIKDHKRLQSIGGKVLRGILMIGPPGCGKTYLAKAIATEANIPFLSTAGSEFVQMFVGVGPARVRTLFKQARNMAEIHGACIIFIDELDAVARQRVEDRGFGAVTEENNTVNQLLVEMDGLSDKQLNVIVIGATNAEESRLDVALLRPGRFDRKIYVDRPSLKDREKLFAFYLAKVKYDPAIDVGRLARRTIEKSPADIENIVKESALIATRDQRDAVTFKDFSVAMERIDMGLKRHIQMTDQERRMTAYHEAGHLIATYFLHPTEDVFKASIVARGGALGVTWHTPKEEIFSESRDMLLSDIKVSLGGYAAEKLKFGVTTEGVSADFQKAMFVAHTMVWRLGMGSNGFIGDYTLLLGDVLRNRGDRISDNMKDQLTTETHRILSDCLHDVEELLTRERVLLDRFAEKLQAKDELEYDEIDAIFAEYGKQQPRLPHADPPPDAPAAPPPPPEA